MPQTLGVYRNGTHVKTMIEVHDIVVLAGWGWIDVLRRSDLRAHLAVQDTKQPESQELKSRSHKYITCTDQNSICSTALSSRSLCKHHYIILCLCIQTRPPLTHRYHCTLRSYVAKFRAPCFMPLGNARGQQRSYCHPISSLTFSRQPCDRPQFEYIPKLAGKLSFSLECASPTHLRSRDVVARTCR
jgi:hypothetical protein